MPTFLFINFKTTRLNIYNLQCFHDESNGEILDYVDIQIASVHWHISMEMWSQLSPEYIYGFESQLVILYTRLRPRGYTRLTAKIHVSRPTILVNTLFAFTHRPRLYMPLSLCRSASTSCPRPGRALVWQGSRPGRAWDRLGTLLHSEASYQTPANPRDVNRGTHWFVKGFYKWIS